MKKLYISIVVSAIVMVMAQSCSKDFLEVDPTNSVSENAVFTTTDNAWAAINGIHRILYSQNGPLRASARMDEAGQHGLVIHLDMLGEDLVNSARGNGWFIAPYQWSAHRTETGVLPYFAYYYLYRIVSNANMIIHGVDQAEGPLSEIDHIKGQAYAYRAWAHWNLVQLYSKRYEAGQTNNQPGIPIMIESTNEGAPRASVEEVYAQILADLDSAAELLEGKPTLAKSHISYNVVKGLQARAHLTMGNWNAAAQHANTARQNLSLMDQEEILEGMSDIRNTEYMWGSEMIQDQTVYFHSYYAFMSVNYNSTNIRTNPKLINERLFEKISDTDIRKQWWVADTTGIVNTIPAPPGGIKMPLMSMKFMSVATSDSRGDLPYMRTAEMFLIEAEALARDGRYADAAQVLYDFVSVRDNEYQLSANTGQALIDEIMIHRRVELWGEGFRFFDLKRTNSALDRTGTNHDSSLTGVNQVPAGDDRWQWLLPRHEIDANPFISDDDQNP